MAGYTGENGVKVQRKMCRRDEVGLGLDGRSHDKKTQKALFGEDNSLCVIASGLG